MLRKVNTVSKISNEIVGPQTRPARKFKSVRFAPPAMAAALLMGLTLLFPLPVAAQDALGNYDHVLEVPPRIPGGFGFPYPPPPLNEPGVTPRRRYMLDGVGELNFCPRPQDEIWLISTRHIEPPLRGDERPECFRHVQRHWQPSQLQQLVAGHRADSTKHTLVFIHGNRTDAFWGQRRGRQAYQAVFGNHPEAPPVRFVIWSWPSDKLPQPLRDFEEKMMRSIVDGHLFGRFLNQLGGQRPVSLFGYSLGTQVLLTAIADQVAAASTAGEAGHPFNVTLVAPVTHCDWPGCKLQSEAVAGQIESISAFRNPRDRAIRAFKMYCRTHSRHGQQNENFGIDRLPLKPGQFSQVDVSAEIGTEHNLVKYVMIPKIQQSVRRMLEPHRSAVAKHADDQSLEKPRRSDSWSWHSTPHTSDLGLY